MGSMAAKLQIDLLDPELYRTNPHELWTQLRRDEPVYRDEANELWALTKHQDILDAERNAEVFSSDGAYRANTGPGRSYERIHIAVQDATGRARHTHWASTWWEAVRIAEAQILGRGG